MEKGIFQNWYENVSMFIEKRFSETDKKLVIIALSRKMPRLMSWIEKKLEKQYVERLHSLIYSSMCVYTTEHAIPFVYSQKEIKDADVLILDDILVTGETVLGIAKEIKEISGNEPFYLSIYAYKENIDKISKYVKYATSNNLPYKLDNIQEVRSKMRYFSKCIKETLLPIDIEFPILYVRRKTNDLNNKNESVFDIMMSEMKNKNPKSRNCFQETKGECTGFTQLVEKDINRLYNNDFAKLRLFRHNSEEARLACYAPNILGDNQVMELDLFTNEHYMSLWRELLESNVIDDTVKDQYDYIITDEDLMRHKISLRLHKSLIVFANYLFSLSMLIRQKSSFVESIPDDEYIVYLHENDLALLLGPSLAKKCIKKLNSLYKESIVSDSIRQELNLPDLLVEDKLKAEYNFLTTLTVFKSTNIDEAIKGIFIAAYKICSDYKDYSVRGKWVLESFQSIYKKPSVLFKGDKEEMEVNRVIDNLIDDGYLVPTYERVSNNDNTFYWRRFFRPTHTIISLLEDNTSTFDIK